VYAFDRVTGEKRWSFRPASGDTPGRYTIATDGTRIFLGSAAGFAHAGQRGDGNAALEQPCRAIRPTRPLIRVVSDGGRGARVRAGVREGLCATAVNGEVAYYTSE
jgi:hypothetical protein